jgi:hypothetical protein
MIDYGVSVWSLTSTDGPKQPAPSGQGASFRAYAGGWQGIPGPCDGCSVWVTKEKTKQQHMRAQAHKHELVGLQ